MSVAGGLENAFHHATQAGCDSLQIFVKNQRQWNAPDITAEQSSSYMSARQAAAVRPITAHASYLINLASPDNDTRRKSIHALNDELKRCELLEIDALIFHPGAHLDQTPRQGIRKIASALNQIQQRHARKHTTILLENTAGQGTTIGRSFSELADIIGQTRQPEQLGVCIDTCHLFAAGYDFRKREGYEQMIEEMESAIGLASVKCIHTNDSKRELGSRVDRHEHIGKGKIGKQGFKHFVNDPRWAGLPFILETPKGKDGRGSDLDKVNLKRLRTLIDPQMIADERR
jgi:deoxyribonuclease-4